MKARPRRIVVWILIAAASLSFSGCKVFIKTTWTQGKLTTRVDRVSGKDRRKPEYDHHLSAGLTRGDPFSIEARCTHTKRTGIFMGRQAVTLTESREVKHYKDYGSNLLTLVAGALLGLLVGAAYDEEEGTSPTGAITFTIIGGGVGLLSNLKSKTREEPTGNVRREKRSKGNVYYLSEPDRVSKTGGITRGARLRFHSKVVRFLDQNGHTVKELKLATDSRGIAEARVDENHGFCGRTGSEAARRVVKIAVGHQARGTALEYLERKIESAAAPARVIVEMISSGDELKGSAGKEHAEASIEVYIADPKTVPSFARDFVAERVNSRIRSVHVQLIQADLRVPVRDATAHINIEGQSPRRVVAANFSGDLLKHASSCLGHWDTGTRRESTASGTFDLHIFTENTQVTVGIEHPDYMPVKKRFRVRVDGQEEAILMQSVRDYVDREINSKVRPLVIRLRDIDTHALVVGPLVNLEDAAPAPDALIPQEIHGERKRKMLSYVRDDYVRHQAKKTADSGTVRFMVYERGAKVKLHVRHRDYHSFSAEFLVTVGHLQKTVYMTETGQPDRSYMADE